MTGKPQRETAKQSLQVKLDLYAYGQLAPIQKSGDPRFKSFSSCFETALFLINGEYIELGPNYLIPQLCSIKRQRYDAIASKGKLPEAKVVHMRIDPDARAFLSFISRKYRPVLGSRGDTASVMLVYLGGFLQGEDSIAWMLNRFDEVVRNHPRRY